ncbi:hypothetical protein D3C85_1254420 [compost metagenome]
MAKKSSKAKKLSKEQFDAQRKAMFDSYGGVKKKQFKELAPRLEHGRGTSEFKSLYGQGKAECGRTNMMEPMVLQKESPEVQAEILRKASRLVPQYNKGAVQYTPDEQDPSDLGRKK